MYDTLVVPVATPVTSPVVASTVAIAALALLQVPPVVVLLSSVVVPWQALNVPVIAAGVGFTVIGCML